MMTACVIAVFVYFPAYKALVAAANPAMAAAVERAPVRVIAHGGECSFQFDPIGKNTFDRTSCDIAKSYLRSEEHTSELQSLMRISYAVFCLTKKARIVHNYTHK